jgi:hypothetical protein
MAERAKLEDIMKRLGELKRARAVWEPLWKDVTAHVLPRRSFWDVDDSSGLTPTTKQYDDSPLSDLQDLADGMQGWVMPPTGGWFHIRMQNRDLQDESGVADWLEAVEAILDAELQRSPFYQAVAEYFLDAMSMGTAVMLIEDDVAKHRVLFSARHLKECYIAEDRAGDVDTLYREYKMTNRAALQAWGDKLDPTRVGLAHTMPFGTFTVIHAVFPRDDRDYNKMDQLNQPWESRYIDKDLAKDIDIGGYKTFPYCVWRYMKNSGEVYGRSPAIDAMPNIMRLQHIGRDMLEASQKGVRPPMNIPSSMKGQERLGPAGFNYFDDPNKVISPINLAQNYAIGDEQVARIQAAVKRHFRTINFLLLEQLADRANITAREIIERRGENTVMLGVICAGLYNSTLLPTLTRTYDIADRNGLIPEAPPALYGGGKLKVVFSGPLAMAANRFHQSQGITAGFQIMLPTAQVFPRSLDNVDEDEMMRIGLDMAGFPQKAIREVDARDAKREAEAKAQAAQVQAQQAANEQALVAQNANKMNEPVKKDSLLDQIGKARQMTGA